MDCNFSLDAKACEGKTVGATRTPGASWLSYDINLSRMQGEKFPPFRIYTAD
jgi:hypothetical protein